ncbi:adenosine deaminase [Podospora appendiculata]|uniref:Adenine deaminase n=1 Tax=Podospora appendiculata TaxID=314037 RepID=A0AAE1C9J4_9PEZI|nr:adenosine deaminase [Podospora appendiculata]
MCKSPLHPLLVSLPKCEHHLHLEGCLTPDLLFALSAQNQIPLPSPSTDPAFASPATLAARYTVFTSLDDFLHYYYIGFRVLVTPADFEALAWSYFLHAHTNANVRHAEVFFDPQAHTSRAIPLSTVIAGFSAAAARAQTELGMSSILIPCLLRHLPVADSAATYSALVAGDYFASGVLGGLGLCSSELAQPPQLWAPIFADANARGIRRTVHAGEEGPPAYVAAALDHLAAMRIDHGVRAAEDTELLARLAADGVMLSLCPVSNAALRVTRSVADAPVRALLAHGVKFSVNSDDPAYFGAWIQDVYCAVQDAFALTADEWAGIARVAVQGSWCGEERKGEMMRELEGVLGEWGRGGGV